jgi:hypothetical protein
MNSRKISFELYRVWLLIVDLLEAISGVLLVVELFSSVS